MAIDFVSANCPACGAVLANVENNREFVFCSHCGSKVMMHNSNEYTYRQIDVAALKKAEMEQMIRLRELEIEEKKEQEIKNLQKVLIYVWLGLALIILLIVLIQLIFNGITYAIAVLFYMGGPVVGGGAYVIFKLIPDRQYVKQMKKNGAITFPKGLEPFTEKNVEHVAGALRSAGFINIDCVNMHDLVLGVLQKPGMIETIMVNGETILSGGKVYMPDAKIVITYHGR